MKFAALRAGEESIDRALAEMDSKLTAWLSAMRLGQAALLKDAGSATTAREEKAALEPTMEIDHRETDDSPVRRGVGLFEGRMPGSMPSGEPKTVGMPEAPANDNATTAAEDEALLASLDEETARAIRVKRRLGNNRQSVRELLDGMRPEQPQ